MPPIPAPNSSLLLSGQATLNLTLNGTLGIKRPLPREIRPGPNPTKKPRSSETILNRRLVGGRSELEVLQQFAEWRILQEGGELGDKEIAHRVLEDIEGDGVVDEEDEDIGDYKGKRYSYSREHKLAAIQYFQTTWRRGNPAQEIDDFVRISVRYAARKLKITRKMLRHWVASKASIQNQKKGGKRASRPNGKAKEPKMEEELNKRFEAARAEGRKISFKWMKRHAMDIYAKLHPQRVIRDEEGKKTYLDFRFSTAWFKGFRRRYGITLRAGTKKAQKAPEELREAIVEWMRYNRRMTIEIVEVDEGDRVAESSEVERFDIEVLEAPADLQPPVLAPPKVGRFYLSEISNMDQSPLPWEVGKNRTYAKRGSKTVLLRTARSGWDKRQCTLQILVFADGVIRCKPLLIFRGKPISKDSRRIKEAKLYNLGVVVVFNEKAYANTKTTIQWVKQQYTYASAFPRSANQPRLLSLDAFAPHKSKGTKKVLTGAALRKQEEMEILQAELKEEFAKLNTTLSIIPGGCTSYVQVLDVSVNKSIKAYIEEYEDQHIDENFEKWQANQYSVSDRRVLMTHWVAKAWKKYHEKHQKSLIDTFANVGMSLNPDGSEDHKIKVKDLPNLTIGDYRRRPTSTAPSAEASSFITKPPSLIIEDDSDTIEVDTGATYVTRAEVAHGINTQLENLNDVTTDSRDDTDARFDYGGSSDEDELMELEEGEESDSLSDEDVEGETDNEE